MRMNTNVNITIDDKFVLAAGKAVATVLVAKGINYLIVTFSDGTKPEDRPQVLVSVVKTLAGCFSAEMQQEENPPFYFLLKHKNNNCCINPILLSRTCLKLSITAVLSSSH